jgi:hypothetical protein
MAAGMHLSSCESVVGGPVCMYVYVYVYATRILGYIRLDMNSE